MGFQWLARHWIRTTAVGLVTTTALSWFAGLTYGMLSYWRLHGFALNWSDARACVTFVLLIFTAAGIGVRWLAKKSLLISKLEARRHPGLILFLSQALGRKDVLDGNNQETAEWADFKKTFAPMVDEFARRLKISEPPWVAAGRASGQVTWCMPMVAIAHQTAIEGDGDVLRRIFVITSADSKGGKNGTWREAAFFEEVIVRLFAEWGRPKDCPRVSFPFASGVNFFDLGKLSDAVERCYKLLGDEGISDVIVDVTGGNKECTIAGAAHALEPGFALQYVSTEDRVVGHYDLTYRSAQSDAG